MIPCVQLGIPTGGSGENTCALVTKHSFEQSERTGLRRYLSNFADYLITSPKIVRSRHNVQDTMALSMTEMCRGAALRQLRRRPRCIGDPTAQRLMIVLMVFCEKIMDQVSVCSVCLGVLMTIIALAILQRRGGSCSEPQRRNASGRTR